MSEDRPLTRSQQRTAYMREAKQRQRLREAETVAATRPDPDRFTIISRARFLELLEGLIDTDEAEEDSQGGVINEAGE